MGLFKKAKPKIDKGLIGWLEEANVAYVMALASRNPAIFMDYGTEDVLRELLIKINNEEEAYEGLLRYQHVEWTPYEGKPLEFLKTTRYDHVQVSYGVSAPMGEDYAELWCLQNSGKCYKVSSMRRLQNEY